MTGYCNTCKHYEGDCGHHFVDFNNHINFDCPSEECCDKCGNCDFFESKEQKKSPTTQIDRIKQLRKEVDEIEFYKVEQRRCGQFIRNKTIVEYRRDVRGLIDNMLKEAEGEDGSN